MAPKSQLEKSLKILATYTQKDNLKKSIVYNTYIR